MTRIFKALLITYLQLKKMHTITKVKTIVEIVVKAEVSTAGAEEKEGNQDGNQDFHSRNINIQVIKRLRSHKVEDKVTKINKMFFVNDVKEKDIIQMNAEFPPIESTSL